MIQHPFLLVFVVIALAASFGWLAVPRDRWHYLRVFATSAAFLAALMGLGAVFGKTLGDFLRGGG